MWNGKFHGGGQGLNWAIEPKGKKSVQVLVFWIVMPCILVESCTWLHGRVYKIHASLKEFKNNYIAYVWVIMNLIINKNITLVMKKYTWVLVTYFMSRWNHWYKHNMLIQLIRRVMARFHCAEVSAFIHCCNIQYCFMTVISHCSSKSVFYGALSI
jgi:hypothetical protein